MYSHIKKRFFKDKFSQKTFFRAKNVFGGTDSFQPETNKAAGYYGRQLF